jgi:hypothetical protein
MVFTKRLRAGVMRGEITTSIRIWTSPHVKVGNRYAMGEGQIEIESIRPIGLPDITPELARESGFLGVLDLLKVAKHGRGSNVYLIRFHYLAPRAKRSRRDSAAGAIAAAGAGAPGRALQQKNSRPKESTKPAKALAP